VAVGVVVAVGVDGCVGMGVSLGGGRTVTVGVGVRAVQAVKRRSEMKIETRMGCI